MDNSKSSIKICVPSVGQDLESEIDSRFGRCKFFIIIEIKNGEILNFKAVENAGAKQGGGAGVSAVEQVSNLGAQIVIAKEVGPKAQSMLGQLDIKVIKDSGVIRKVIKKYINQ